MEERPTLQTIMIGLSTVLLVLSLHFLCLLYKQSHNRYLQIRKHDLCKGSVLN